MTLNTPQPGVGGRPVAPSTTPQQTVPQLPGAGPVNRVEFFRRMPTGGTVFVRPSDSDNE